MIFITVYAGGMNSGKGSCALRRTFLFGLPFLNTLPDNSGLLLTLETGFMTDQVYFSNAYFSVQDIDFSGSSDLFMHS